MRLPLLWICLGLTPFTLAADPKPLAEVAPGIAKNLQAGCIVTGEWRDGVETFNLAGKGIEGLPAEKHVFEIGSISKVFTGLLLARAVIEKKVTLTTTLRDLLGTDFTFADPNVATITLEQLSTHTSGLPRLPGNIGLNPDGKPDPYADYDRDALHDYLHQAKISSPAPHPAAYSNLGAGLLGDLLARLYDTTWEQLVIDRITQPLGMSDTRVSLNDDLRQRLAPPHQGAKPGTNWHFQAMAGAGALRSTAEDMLRFGKALLQPGGTPFPEAIRFMLEPRAAFSGPNAKIGLGIILARFMNEPVWEHDGGTGGYRTSFQVQPESSTVRIILINNDALAPQSLLAALNPEPKTAPASEQPLSAESASEFTGVFELSPQASFTIIQRGDHLWTRLTGQPFFRLFYSGNDRFFLKVAPAELQFARTDGVISQVTLFQNSREQQAIKSAKALPKLIFRPAKELQPLTGSYDLAPGMVFTVTIKAQTLFLELTGQPALPVFETRPDHFEYDVVEAAVEFEKAADGSVTALVLHQNGKHRAPRRTGSP